MRKTMPVCADNATTRLFPPSLTHRISPLPPPPLRCLAVLHARTPTSLQLTWALLTRAREEQWDLAEALKMEYRVVLRLAMEGAEKGDLVRGVRGMLNKGGDGASGQGRDGVQWSG